MNIPQQINFTGKFEEDDGATKFVIAEKQQKQKQFWIFLQIDYFSQYNIISNLLNEANDFKY